MQEFNADQMDQFANFLTSEYKGSFSNINFNIVKFCGDDFYGWKFPSPDYVRDKISKKLCIKNFDANFLDFLLTIYASSVVLKICLTQNSNIFSRLLSYYHHLI